jgi:hypothetical protein
VNTINQLHQRQIIVRHRLRLVITARTREIQ